MDVNKIYNGDCFDFMKYLDRNSIDLILVDAPYNISRSSNFKSGKLSKFNQISIDFGYWDTEIDLDTLFKEYYRVLRKGGTLVLFYDIWKSSIIKEFAAKNKFKQPRIGQWLKNNPVPVNSKINYLSNCSEYFFTFGKDKNATFNSEYDNGIYNYPLCHGKERLEHPTQKPLGLIKDLIVKHSNENDLILDTFSGTATTAIACEETSRRYICIERDDKYHKIATSRLESYKQVNRNKI